MNWRRVNDIFREFAMSISSLCRISFACGQVVHLGWPSVAGPCAQAGSVHPVGLASNGFVR
jgi:hypothetical protein